MDLSKLYDLKLGETLVISEKTIDTRDPDVERGEYSSITRVPGGWIWNKVYVPEPPVQQFYNPNVTFSKRSSWDVDDSYDENCLHDTCELCNGTGIKKDGSMCIHNISCPCPKCSPMC